MSGESDISAIKTFFNPVCDITDVMFGTDPGTALVTCLNPIGNYIIIPKSFISYCILDGNMILSVCDKDCKLID